MVWLWMAKGNRSVRHWGSLQLDRLVQQQPAMVNSFNNLSLAINAHKDCQKVLDAVFQNFHELLIQVVEEERWYANPFRSTNAGTLNTYTTRVT